MIRTVTTTVLSTLNNTRRIKALLLFGETPLSDPLHPQTSITKDPSDWSMLSITTYRTFWEAAAGSLTTALYCTWKMDLVLSKILAQDRHFQTRTSILQMPIRPQANIKLSIWTLPSIHATLTLAHRFTTSVEIARLNSMRRSSHRLMPMVF